MRGRGSGSDEGFIREVDEAVRQEQWLSLWKRYGAIIVGAALAIVIGTGGTVAWRSYQESQRVEEARRYAAAQQLLSADRPEEAAAAFANLAEAADGGYAVLARLRAAGARGQAGDDEAKRSILAELADAADADPVFRELALLHIAQQDLDAGDPAAAMARLDRLAEGDSPWRHSAMELRALAQLQSGDTAAARQTLDDLLDDPQTPPNLSRRAAELMTFLGGPLEVEEPEPVDGDTVGDQ